MRPCVFVRSNVARAVFAVFFLLGLGLPMFGQSNFAVLSGTVTDQKNLPIAGASIEITARSTGAIRRTQTNQDGLFEAPALSPDDYDVQVQAQGFAPATESLRLEVNQKLAIEISLKIGPIAQGVKIVASTEVLNKSDASRAAIHKRTAAERPNVA